jgi:hypothetical protein
MIVSMQPISRRTAWQLGSLLSVLALAAVSVEIAHSQLPMHPAVFAEVHVDAPLLKLLAGSPPDFEDDLQTHAEFIARPAVLEAALKRPEIADLAIVKRQEPNSTRWLARHVQVESRPPTTLRIYYVGEPSREAVTVVNAVAEAYIDEILEVTSRLRAERIDELQRAQRDVEHRLGEKRVAISRLTKLLSAAEKSQSGTEPGEQSPVSVWTRELENLIKAVTEGEEIDARIKAELAKLENSPHQTGVGMIRIAESRR